MKIPLPDGQFALVDEADRDLVKGFPWYVTSLGYVLADLRPRGGTHVFLHRLIMGTPAGLHTDHRNGDKLDNRRDNLRVATPQQNQINRRRLNKNNTSGARGVQKTSWGKWWGRIMCDGKSIHLGTFDTFEAARAARREAELALYGEHCPDL